MLGDGMDIVYDDILHIFKMIRRYRSFNHLSDSLRKAIIYMLYVPLKRGMSKEEIKRLNDRNIFIEDYYDNGILITYKPNNDDHESYSVTFYKDKDYLYFKE